MTRDTMSPVRGGTVDLLTTTSGPSIESAIEPAADSTKERSASPPSPSGVLTAMMAYSAPGTASWYDVVKVSRLALVLRSTSSLSPGSKKGTWFRSSCATFSRLVSTTITSLPRSARHAAVVRPTYPAPMTATLDKAGRLSQEAFITRDGLARGLAPAEPFGPLEPSAAGPSRVLGQGRRGSTQCLGIPIRDQLARITHDLGQARVSERRHRTAARRRLQARQPEALVPARKQEAARGGVKVGKLGVVDVTEHVGSAHAVWSLATRMSGDHKLEPMPQPAGGKPCFQQRVGILSCVQRADEQQVPRRQPPPAADAVHGSRPRLELVAGRLGHDPDALGVDLAQADRIVSGRLRHRQDQIRSPQQPPPRPEAESFAAHRGASPRPGDEVMKRDGQRHRRPAWQPEVDGVVDVGRDSGEVGIEAFFDEAAEDAVGVGADTTRGARALKRAHVEEDSGARSATSGAFRGFGSAQDRAERTG